MKLDKKQVQLLEKLSRKDQTEQCFIKENIIMGLYLDDYWHEEFDDESLYHYHTPEYTSAKAAFYKSVKPLIEAGLVEKQQGRIEINSEDINTPVCYRITKYGSHALEILR